MADEDFTSTILLSLDLPHGEMRDAKLAFSFLSGDVSHADLSEADLRDANLSHLNIAEAVLTYADLGWSTLPEDELIKGVRLEGADWWAAEQLQAPKGANLTFKSRKILDYSPIWSCPASESHGGDGEIETFSISGCGAGSERMRSELEAAYPEKQNTAKRKEHFKTSAPSQ